MEHIFYSLAYLSAFLALWAIIGLAVDCVRGDCHE